MQLVVQRAGLQVVRKSGLSPGLAMESCLERPQPSTNELTTPRSHQIFQNIRYLLRAYVCTKQ